MANSTQNIPVIQVDPKKLPSRGISYPDTIKISYRTYLYGEISYASSSNLTLLDRLKDALKGVQVEGMGKFQLTIGDVFYLALLRKISTLSGIEMSMPYRCQKCNSIENVKFTEKDISFNDLSEEVTDLPICVEIGSKALEFYPMTFADYIDVYEGKFNSFYPKNEEGKPKVNAAALQATWIKNLDYKEAFGLLHNLSNAEDMEVVEEIDRLLKHDIEKLDAKCKSCGHDNKVKVEGREALIGPFRGRESSKGHRISFGKTHQRESGGPGSDGVSESPTVEQEAVTDSQR